MKSVLTITKVSESDLYSEFRCKAKDSVNVIFVSVTLNSPGEIYKYSSVGLQMHYFTQNVLCYVFLCILNALYCE